MFTKKESTEIVNWFQKSRTFSGTRNQNHSKDYITPRQKFLLENPCPHQNKIKFLYEEGYGFKSLSKNIGLTHMNMRWLIQKGIPNVSVRTGMNSITEPLREMRREWAKKNSVWNDWPNKRPDLTSGRSVQGYYKRKKGKKVWLRSTLEYSYAKWLDNNNMNWEYEVSVFDLSNGQKYRPDFFVYDTNNKLQKIIEIKGDWLIENRAHKIDLFRSDYPEINIEVITDLSPYSNNS